MTALNWVSGLLDRGIELLAREDGLAVGAGRDRLTAADRDALRAGKAEILAMLAALGVRSTRQLARVSTQQAQLWLIHRMAPEDPRYNESSAYRLRGRLDVDLLRAAVRALVERHEILRTRYAELDGAIWQIIDASAEIEVRTVDLGDVPPGDRDRAIGRLLAACDAEPFDLATGPILRVTLARFDADDHVLALNLHHVAADRWSLNVLHADLSEAYAGARLDPAPLQYADYAAWQRRTDDEERRARDLDGWRLTLAGAPSVHALPMDRPRPAALGAVGARVRSVIPASVADRLRRLCASRGATLFVGLDAAWAAFIGRLSGETDVVSGTVVANRDRAELAGALGYFVNTLVLRTDLSGAPAFATLIERCRDSVFAAFERKDLPFQDLVDALNPIRSPSQHPLFQLMLVLQNHDDAPLRLPGVEVTPWTRDEAVAKFELALIVGERAGGELGLDWEYATDLFDADTVERWAGLFGTFVAAAVSEPNAPVHTLPMMPTDQHDALVDQLQRGASVDHGWTLVHDAVAEQAVRAPNRIAIRCGAETVTYGALRAKVVELAARLVRLGIAPEQRVGLCVERSTELVVALLAVFEAGGVALPLDPELPTDRLRFIAVDADAALVLCHASVADRVSDVGCPVVVLDAPADVPAGGAAPVRPRPDDLAYVIYTSGSTGRPKGCAVEHRHLAATLATTREALGFGADDVMPCLASYAFDIALLELLLPLVAGGTTRIVRAEVVRDVPALIEETRDATFLHAVPSLMAAWLTALPPATAPAAYPALRCLLVGGDAVPRHLCAALTARLPDVAVVELYGPTEATIISTMHRVGADDALVQHCIGRRFATTSTFVLDDGLRLQPVGVAGELYLGGCTLARGYLGRPELDAERFVPDPFAGVDGARLYRTGDRVRLLANGELEFLGRADHQVKIRGFRIELGEIEAALRTFPGIADAVAVARDTPSGKQLVAYHVAEADAQPASDEVLRVHLAGTLPAYMVPARFVRLDALPLNPNGKVDRAALPPPDVGRDEGSARVAPRTATERALAVLWTELLGLERASADTLGLGDNFFALGGHSLLATRLTTAVHAAFGVRLPVRAVFERQTLDRLADAVDEAVREAEREAERAPVHAAEAPPSGKPRDALPSASGARHPLSAAQRRIWLAEQLSASGAAWDIPTVVDLVGPVDRETLERAFAAVVDHHEVLRTVYGEVDGEPYQEILPPGAPFALSATAPEPFDLRRGPIVRASLVASAPELHRLSLAVHHIASDGWSHGVLVQDLGAAYAALRVGRAPVLPPAPRYVDVAADPDAAADVAAWADALADLPAVHGLPLDHPRPAAWSGRGGLVSRSFDGRPLAAFARARNATAFAVIAAALGAWLHRRSGGTDLAIGVPLANRADPARARVVGCLVNTAVLRLDLTGDPRVTELLDQVRARAVDAVDRQAAPFDAVVDAVRPARDPAYHPLFQVMLTVDDEPLRWPSDELALAWAAPDAPPANFDLTFHVRMDGGTLTLFVVYARDLFEPDTADAIADDVLAALSGVIAASDRRVSELALSPRADDRAYWRSALADLAPVDWPCDRPWARRGLRRAVAAAGEPDLAAFVLLAHRWTGLRTFAVAVVDHGHRVLPVRVDLTDVATCAALADRVGDALVDARAHADNVPDGATAELRLRFGGSVDQASSAVGVDLALTDDGVFVFDPDRLDPASAARMAGHYRNLVTAVGSTAPLRAAPMLTADERHELLVTWNGADVPLDPLPIHHRVALQVARTPDATALALGDRTLSYAALHRSARRLAARLRALGVGRDARVAVCAPRSFELVIALLAVLHAGGAYVPLDPDQPAERLAAMIDDARPAVLVAPMALAEWLSRSLPPGVAVLDLDCLPALPDPGPEDLMVEVAPDDLAYVLFTSGSTGRPKGAMNTHRGIGNLLQWIQATHPLDGADAVLHKTTFAFDVSVWEIFGTLLAGARLVLPEPGEQRDPAALVALVERHAVTMLLFVPSMLSEFLDALPAGGGRSLRRVFCGGEVLPPELCDRVFRQLPHVELYNEYGPTECAIDVTIWRCTPEDRRPVLPIGRPIANTTLRILDPDGGLVPALVTGELYIGGAPVGRGYVGRDALTAERFVPDTFAGPTGGTLYRTGDLARYLSDGSLVWVGRVDDQVKVRGFRVEPGEIEAVLGRVPGVTHAAVVARGAGDDVRLVAFVAPFARCDAELRAIVEAALPDWLVPSAFVGVDRMPISPNGKIDRGALRDGGSGGATPAGDAPRTELERQVCAVWAEVLGLPSVPADVSFFRIGGHSLLATRLIARLRSRFGVALGIRAIFEHQTVRALSAAIAVAEPSAPSTLAPVPRDGRALPLSFAQQRFWLLDQLDPGSARNNLSGGLVLDGELSAPALVRAFEVVTERHEVLRTRFVADRGEPQQRVDPPGTHRIRELDLSAMSSVEQARSLDEIALREASTPFDLAVDPPMRVAIVKLGPARHALLFTLHHVASDGWSNGLLHDELSAAYRHAIGAGPPLPPVALQYADYAHWQRRNLDGSALDELLAWWKQELHGAPTVHALPLDRPRPPVQRHLGDRFQTVLSPALSAGLRRVAASQRATLFMALHAAFGALLSRVSNEPDILVGTSVANREQPEVAGVVGLFMNPLPLRLDLGGDPTFAALVSQSRTRTLGAFEHQQVPFEPLVQALGVERTPAVAPLLQVMLILQNNARAELDLPGVEVTCLRYGPEAARLDLMVDAVEVGDTIELDWEFDVDLFDRGTVARMAACFEVLVEAAVASPDQRMSALPIVPAAERRRQLAWNGAALDLSGALVPARISAWSCRTPEAVAVIDGDRRLTYRELGERADRLAAELQRLGAGPERIVAVAVERSLEMAVAFVGVLRAGAAYLPVSLDQPTARIRAIVDAASPVAVVAAAPFDVSLPVVRLDALAGAPSVDVEPVITASNLAYAIFTSGSTGAPKGVLVEHGSILSSLLAWTELYGLDGATRTHLQLAGIGFDVCVGDLVRALATGGTLVVCPRSTLLDPPALHALIAQHGVQFAEFVPASLRHLVDHLARAGETLRGVRYLVAGSDVWTADDLARTRAVVDDDTVIVNSYGLTEAAVDSACAMSRAGDAPTVGSAPIGRPLAGVQVHVVNGALQPCPIGVSGELCIGGPTVARGYLADPVQTAARFVPDPFGALGARLYRTGDRARWREDGQLELLGRVDAQLKIRGFRVEPGEVEACLRAHPSVRAAAVVDFAAPRGDRQLAAWVVFDGPPDVDAVRAHLEDRLPDWLVPAAIGAIDVLPTNANGKVDRGALPAPVLDRPHRPAETATEQALAALWSEVLGLEPCQIGAETQFFRAGGHSLSAARLAAAATARFGRPLSIRAVFEHPTLRRLAARIDAIPRDAAPDAIPVVDRTGRLPLSFAQQRLWLIDRLEPGRATYNLAVGLRLTGPLEADRLERAFHQVIARHEALRTTYHDDDGRAFQRVLPDPPFALVRVEVGGSDAASIDVAARRLAEREASAPFDLRRDLPLRGTLATLGDEEHLLLVTVHHIAADGWSISVLTHELSAAYAGRALPPLPVQYGDFAVWQRAALDDARLDPTVAFWRERLTGLPPVHQLPLDRPRPAVQSFRGARVGSAVGARVLAGIEALAHALDTTPFTVLQAAFAVLLSRQSGEADVVIGVPNANRDRPELAPLVGFFVNTSVVRTDVSADPTFRALVADNHRRAVEALDHQHLPFERLVEALQPARSLDRHPLFQVLMVLQNNVRARLDLDGLHSELFLPDAVVAKFDLALELAVDDGELLLHWEYATDLFDEATITRMARQFGHLLGEVVADPDRPVSRLPLLDEDDLAALRRLAGPETLPPAPPTVCALFEAVCGRYPDRVAVRHGDACLTYRELRDRVAATAAELRADVGPGAVVGLHTRRTFGWVVGALAILDAGAVMLPLEPSYPAERLAFVVADAGAQLVLADPGPCPAFTVPVRALVHPVDIPVTTDRGEAGADPAPDALAYVIHTSGSTGRPKGVAVHHAALAQTLLDARDALAFGPDDRLTCIASPAFDISLLELLLPLISGGCAVLVDDADVRDPARLVEVTSGVTVVHAVPSLMAAWLDRIDRDAVRTWIDGDPPGPWINGDPPGPWINGDPPVPWINGDPPGPWIGQRAAAIGHADLRCLLVGGDAVPRSLLDAMKARFPAVDVVELYGPTEAAIISTYHRVGERHAQVPHCIGGRFPHAATWVVDNAGALVPIGVAGELCIGGSAVARGYVGQAELTASRFAPDPWLPDGRMYRTGDRVRMLPDGQLAFLGRADDQVKIRGFRIELGEVESAMLAVDGVSAGAVVARPGPGGDLRLLGYYVAADDTVGERLPGVLASALPAHMVPALVRVDALPLSPNGKVDRRALPEPDAVVKRGHSAPRDGVEAAMVEVWQELLGVAPIGVDDDFFALGGHSLLAVQLASRILRRFGTDLPIRAVLESPTPAGLAARIDRTRLSATSAAADGGPGGLIEDEDGAFDPFPLTAIQQAYWLGRSGDFDLGNVGSHVYLEIPSAPGAVDPDRLEQAWNRLIARHPMLRMVVTADGRQRVLPEVPRYRVERHDWTGDRGTERRDALRARLSHQVFTGTDWPLFELHFGRGDAGDLVHLSMDGLATDAASTVQLGRELSALLLDPERDLPPIGIRFRDYVLTEVALREAGHAAKSRQYWLDRLPTFPGPPELRLARDPRAIASPRFEGRSLVVDGARWARLRAWCGSARVTPTVALLGCFGEVVKRWSRRHRFALNLTLFNRLDLHPQVHEVVGDFTSLTLLELDLQDARTPFGEVLAAIQARLWADLEHRHFGGVEVQRELSRLNQRATSFPVVFTSTLGIANASEGPTPFDTDDIYAISQTPQVWLDCQVSEGRGRDGSDALLCKWDSVDGLFPDGMVDRMFERFTALVMDLCDAPAVDYRPDTVPPADRALVARVNATDVDLSGVAGGGHLLHGPLLGRIAAQPDAVAVVSAAGDLTYRQLGEDSERLARALVADGAAPGDRIAVVMDKGPAQIVAVLGVLRAGGAYLPIDAGLPDQRVRELIALGRVEQVVTVPDVAPRLDGLRTHVVEVGRPAGLDLHLGVTLPEVDGSALAYVIFTSGSTGTPKGVMIAHAAALNTVLDLIQRFGLGSDTVGLGLSSLSFDLSVFDVFGVLGAGGRLVLPAADDQRDPEAWLEAVHRHGVTLWNSVPALLQLLVDATPPRASLPLRHVWLSGDWIPVSLPDRARAIAPGAVLTSMGGATEASIWSILYPIGEVDPAWASVPYGAPLANQRFYVLGPDLELAPVGAVGELYIGGVGLAAGYWDDPERTARRFVVHPTTGARLYRTGDLGRLGPDGQIVFLGREDAQVKVQGYRIELGEIEARLHACPGVADAVVDVADGDGGKQLVAYVVAGGANARFGAVAITDPAEREAFTLDQRGLVRDWTADAIVGLSPAPDDALALYPSTASGTIGITELGATLAAARAVSVAERPVPKRWYPSAGSLYPVSVHVVVAGDDVDGLPAGVWRYDPTAHALARWMADVAHGAPALPAGATLALVADLAAIAPMYGQLAEDFAAIEAGCLAELLDAASPGGVREVALEDSDAFGATLGLGATERALCAFRLGDHRSPRLAPAPSVLPLAARKSYRRFGGDPGAGDARIVALLAALPEHPDVQVFVWWRGRGTLRVDADGLVPLDRGVDAREVFRGGDVPVDDAALAVLLVGPSGGDRRPALLQAGRIVQRLSAAAPGSHLGFCPIGLVEPSAVEPLGLGDDRAVVHALIGGWVTDAEIASPGTSEAPESGSQAGSDLAATLEAALRASLPAYMVPRRFVAIDRVPLSSNGKVDRSALPKQPTTVSRGYVAARTATERALAEVWREVLGVAEVGATDSFFELGGDSMRAIGVLTAARRRGLRFSVRDLYARPTVAALAEVTELDARAALTAAVDDGPAPFALLSDASREALAAELASGAVVDAYPLTLLQSGMIAHNLRDGDRGTYHDVLSSHLALPWDPDAFAAALAWMTERHATLRTALRVDVDPPVQVVLRSHVAELEVFDLRGAAAADDRIRAWVDQELTRPFDGPPWRVAIHLRSDDRLQYSLACHHALLDGWSVAQLTTELLGAYGRARAGELGPAEPSLTYNQFVAAELAALKSPDARAYWTRAVGGAPSPWWSGASARAQVRRTFAIDGDRFDAVRALARAAGVQERTVFLAAHLVLVGLLAGTADVCTSVVTNARPERQGAEAALGLFLNALPIRLDVRDLAFSDLVRQVEDALTDAAPFRAYPVARIQADTGLDFGGSLFTYVQFHAFDGLAVESHGDLAVDLTNYLLATEVAKLERSRRFEVTVVGDPDALGAGLLDRAFAYAQRVLVACLGGGPIERAALLGDDERMRLVHGFDDAARPFPREALVHGLFEQQVRRTPDAVAVTFEGSALTYAELDRRANQLARHLRALGVGVDAPVGLFLERSLALVVAIYAVFKAGGAYLPLDPEHPPARLAGVASDAGVQVILTQRALAPRLVDVPGLAIPVDDPDVDAMLSGLADDDLAPNGQSSASLAYVITTSGSTGRPKAVMSPHVGLVNRVLWMDATWPLGPGDVVLQKTPYGFDVSVWEFVWPLVTGARLVVAAPDGHKDPAYLERVIRDEGVTHLHFVPSMLRVMLDLADLGACPSLRQVMCSGEALPAELVAAFYRTGTRAGLHNLYGPTEASIDVSHWACPRGTASTDEVPIGRPIHNTTLRVLDADRQLVPIGVPGELYIGGVGLARGYLGRAELTAERFVPDPFADGERLYRTGDLAKVRDDGCIVFLGRIDHQVKIRGQRIELGEIEAQLLGARGVRSAAVTVDDGQLVGYVVLTDDAEPVDLASILRHLREQLPVYMVPSVLVPIDALPLSPNGKLDRKALPAPSRAARAHVAPTTAAEAALCDVWARLLGRAQVGVDDNFFELGGDSILAIRAVAAAAQAGLRLSVRLVFDHPTIAALAPHCAPLAGVEPIEDAGEGDGVLTPIHRWFFDGVRTDRHHWNQAMAVWLRTDLPAEQVGRAFAQVIVHHPVFTARFDQASADDPVRVRYDGGAPTPRMQVRDVVGDASSAAAVDELQRSFDLEHGPIVGATLLRYPDGRRSLVVAAHHLAIDAVSWGILLDDLDQVLASSEAGHEPGLAPATSFARAAAALTRRLAAADPGWTRPDGLRLAGDPDPGTHGASRRLTIKLDPRSSSTLLAAGRPGGALSVEASLLAALGLAVGSDSGPGVLIVDVEGHGRDLLGDDGIDLSRAVGWFTAIRAVAVPVDPSAPLAEQVRGAKRARLAASASSIAEQAARARGAVAPAEILVNYLGGAIGAGASGRALGDAAPCGGSRSDRGERTHRIEVNAMVVDGRLCAELTCPRGFDVEAFGSALVLGWRSVAELAQTPAALLVPEDFPSVAIGDRQLSALIGQFGAPRALYPATPLQREMLRAPQTRVDGANVVHMVVPLNGALDPTLLARAWQSAVDGLDALRTRFVRGDGDDGDALQVVLDPYEVRIDRVDLCGLDPAAQSEALASLVAEDRARGFEPREPQSRWTLVGRGPDAHALVWTFSYRLLDGWSIQRVIHGVLDRYDALDRGQTPAPWPTGAYAAWTAWCRAQPIEDATRRWVEAMSPLAPLASRLAPLAATADQPRIDAFKAWHVMEEADSERVRTEARRAGVTPSTLALAAWAVVLARRAGSDVSFGVTVSGRSAALPGLEETVGSLINILPVRMQLDPEQPVDAWVREVQRSQVAAREREWAPIDAVARALGLGPADPLFDSYLVFENFPLDPKGTRHAERWDMRDSDDLAQTAHAVRIEVFPGARLLLTLGSYRSLVDDAGAAALLDELAGCLVAVADGLARGARVGALAVDAAPSARIPSVHPHPPSELS